MSETVVERASAGEALARETLDVWEGRLARALATIVNVLDPHVIVIGGGLSALDRIYTNVPTLWGRWIFSTTSPREWFARSTATRPAFAGRRGCGRSAAGLEAAAADVAAVAGFREELQRHGWIPRHSAGIAIEEAEAAAGRRVVGVAGLLEE